ncbi:MAG TPA: MtnX-like HAD-IB family phosphatase [Anaerolineae bacterium]|nr:MtnX-like HAD-IB family phosphatase [Anaerolineae bacterium]
MQVTKRSEYSILSVLYLAEHDGVADIGEIAAAQRIPDSLVAKALQELVKAGILASKRGPGGGFSLARPAGEINLLEIIEATEGPIAISECLADSGSCNSYACRLEPVWRSVQDSIRTTLARVTVQGVIDAGRGATGTIDIVSPGQDSAAFRSGDIHATRPIILCDFDGTISKQDVSDTIFTLWLGETWAAIDNEYHNEKLSMVELYERCWSLVDAGEDELYDFIDRVEIDPHFEEFIRQSRASGIPVFLVSDGFDLYIDRIMGRYGLSDLVHYSNHLSFDGNRPVPEFNNRHPECTQCANCKKFVMDEKRNAADFTIYIGNGFSDRCAAEHADLVFAKDSLLEHCRDKGIPHVPYEHFGEIVKYLEEYEIFKR